jgi:hypothetical protein
MPFRDAMALEPGQPVSGPAAPATAVLHVVRRSTALMHC